MARRKKNKRKKILLVDDNHETLEIISHLVKLRDDRIDVIGSPSAEEGLLELSGIDVLVTDLRLPGMGGVDFLKRARRRNKELPAIIISGLDEPEAKKLIGDVEIEAFVGKPYKPDDLINVILKATWGDDALPPPAESSLEQNSGETDQVKVPKSPRSDIFHPPLSKQTISRLEQLQSGTMAHQIILWALDGTLLYVLKEEERREAEKLGKLAISSVANGLEILVRSGSTPTQLMYVLDGEPYEIILAYIKSKRDYCLAVTLDGGAKLGTVWGAMQRSVADLAIRLNPDSDEPAELAEPADEEIPAPQKQPENLPAETAPTVESNPIASDEDLEKLIDDLLDDDVNEGELDALWGTDSSVTSLQTAGEETRSTSEPLSESPFMPDPQPDSALSEEDIDSVIAELQAESVDEPETEEVAEDADELAQTSGLEGMLVESGEVIDERWEEVKGMLGLDSEADDFWEQAIAENLNESSNEQARNDSNIMSYEEALKKGLLSDQET